MFKTETDRVAYIKSWTKQRYAHGVKVSQTIFEGRNGWLVVTECGKCEEKFYDAPQWAGIKVSRHILRTHGSFVDSKFVLFK